jgi:secreted trypsin-like serine protease
MFFDVNLVLFFSRGDSGGPLMRQNERGSPPYWYLAGLVSFGPTPCGQANWPGVYTRVSYQLHFRSVFLKLGVATH